MRFFYRKIKLYDAELTSIVQLPAIEVPLIVLLRYIDEVLVGVGGMVKLTLSPEIVPDVGQSTIHFEVTGNGQSI